MYFSPFSSTIVLAGKWNPYILTPIWVGQNLFDQKEIKAEIVFGPENITKIMGEKIHLIPSSTRVVLVAPKAENENLIYIENIGKKLVELLPHTPITALGFNFEIIENSPPDYLLDLFSFSDNENLSQHYTIINSKISRRLKGENHIINFRISKNSDSDALNIIINFHYDCNDIGLASVLNGNTFVTHFDFLKRLLQENYSLSFENIIGGE